MQDPQKHQFLSAKEVADVFRVNESTVWRWIAEGILPTVRVGGTTRILREDWQRLLRAGRTVRVVCPNCGRGVTRQCRPPRRGAFRQPSQQ
jgi:excisionase family DNA binding protein